jgi:DUF971 family protein
MSCEPEIDAPPWPSAITLHRASRTLHLSWGDAEAAVPHGSLRLACRCAECESRRRHGPAGVPPVHAFGDVELLRIEPVGVIGLQFLFSDGHQRGIYPWAYLREIALKPIAPDHDPCFPKGEP